ncbi:MAG: N-acetyltransferase [Planctomycetes bacterium]|nr:N-acetyltransferase [Planctomycetota bacterium]
MLAVDPVPLDDRRALLRFIRLPGALYPPESPWVAPLERERLRFFDPRRNPFFRRAEARLFVARDGRGRDVGRIAAIDDHSPSVVAAPPGPGRRKLGSFGFFDAADDLEAARALFGAAEEWLRARGCTAAQGPLSPSTSHECGCLVAGFERRPKLFMPYNHAYYGRIIEACGYRAVQDLVAYEAPVPSSLPQRLARAERIFARRRAFTVRRADLRRLDEEVAHVHAIYNDAWSENFGFTPLTRGEIEWLARELRPVLHPDFCRIAEVRGEPAGVMIALPDVYQALRPLRGRLFPLGWLRLFWGLRRVDGLHGLVMGVRPRFRKLGIDHAFYLEGLRAAWEHGYKTVELSWVLAHNAGILRPLERLGALETKRYRLYEKAL